MKFLLLLFLTIFLGKAGCGDQQRDLNNAVIEYTANTRGFYQKITIKDKSVAVSRVRDEKAPRFEKLSDSNWDELAGLLKSVDLDGLSNLKAPTEKRYYDGAAMADLKITYKDSTYQSSTFDHGYPPVEIEKLINKINSFAPER